MISVLSWNCRGLVNVATQGALVSLVLQKRPDILFLSETLAQPALLDSLKGKMGFAGCVCVHSGRDSRGLGLFWSIYSYHHIDAELMPNLADLADFRFVWFCSC